MDSTLTAAVSGLLAQSSGLSNISSNLANSETTGYKAVSTSFDSLLTSTTGSTATTVTSGVSAQTRQDVTAQGTIATTTTSTDLAIDGNGMFAVTQGESGTSTYYTRDGAFDTDSSGNLVMSGTDYYLQGYPTDSSGNATSTTLQNVNISATSTSAKATTTYSLSANLPAEDQTSVYSQSYTSTDDNSTTESVTYGYSKISTDSSGNTTYQLAISDSNSSATLTDDDGTTSTAGQPLLYDVTVDSSGNISSVTNAQTGQTTSASPSLPSVTPSDSSSTVSAPASWSDLGSSASTSSSITVYDSLGTAQTLPVTWTAEGNDQWLMTVSSPENSAGSSSGSLTDSTGATVSSYSYQVTFNSDGSLGSVVGLPTSSGGTAPMAGTNEPALSATWSDGATASTTTNGTAITLNLGTSGSTDGLTQYDSGDTTPAIDVKNTSQDGLAYGTLSSVAVNSTGEVMATYSNGSSVPIYKIPVVTFPNEDGLTAQSDNVYQASATSGSAIINTAGSNGSGTIEGGALESSTTSTTTELSTMITAQQAYSANAQVISTDRSDFTTLMQSTQ
jgi:flagellar hook protein FlgE